MSGYGNFHMKPNGVFYISADRAAVAETRAFLMQGMRADLATPSWPMLVINGRVHPRFDERSTSLKARNGVGVGADGKVIFAISQGEVTFDAFARLFRGTDLNSAAAPHVRSRRHRNCSDNDQPDEDSS